MDYILQHPDFCLGNFINLTPAIQWLHRQRGERIPVYFSTDYVRDCFWDCPFIQILYEKPEHGPLFGSNLVNPNDDKPDYQFVFEFLTLEKWTNDWHTFVDYVQLSANYYLKKHGSFTVVINGAGNQNNEYVQKKDPGEDWFKTMLADKNKIVFVGSQEDAKRSPYLVRWADIVSIGNIRSCLAWINAADCVIANDTGLAHAAGAMNKNLTVLVKDGPRERIKNPGQNTTYIYL